MKFLASLVSQSLQKPRVPNETAQSAMMPDSPSEPEQHPINHLRTTNTAEIPLDLAGSQSDQVLDKSNHPDHSLPMTGLEQPSQHMPFGRIDKPDESTSLAISEGEQIDPVEQAVTKRIPDAPHPASLASLRVSAMDDRAPEDIAGLSLGAESVQVPVGTATTESILTTDGQPLRENKMPTRPEAYVAATQSVPVLDTPALDMPVMGKTASMVNEASRLSTPVTPVSGKPAASTKNNEPTATPTASLQVARAVPTNQPRPTQILSTQHNRQDEREYPAHSRSHANQDELPQVRIGQINILVDEQGKPSANRSKGTAPARRGNPFGMRSL